MTLSITLPLSNLYLSNFFFFLLFHCFHTLRFLPFSLSLSPTRSVLSPIPPFSPYPVTSALLFLSEANLKAFFILLLIFFSLKIWCLLYEKQVWILIDEFGILRVVLLCYLCVDGYHGPWPMLSRVYVRLSLVVHGWDEKIPPQSATRSAFAPSAFVFLFFHENVVLILLLVWLGIGFLYGNVYLFMKCLYYLVEVSHYCKNWFACINWVKYAKLLWALK